MNKRWRYLLLLGGLCGFALAQTQVSLRTQTKSADLSAVGPTKPMQTGATLPAACGTGEMFFLTTAAAGSNLYTCAATNAWTEVVSLASVTQGTGTIVTTVGSTINLAVDPALIPTRTVVQASTSNICTPTSSSATAVTCTMNPTLAAYSNGMLVELTWNVACAGTETLAIDGLAPTNLREADGATILKTTDCASGQGASGAGQTNVFSYDGTHSVFKLVGGGLSSGSVTGPGSATANDGACFNGNTGTIVKDCGFAPQPALTLTTSGSSGAATLSGGALNIPQYSGGPTLLGASGQQWIPGIGSLVPSNDTYPQVTNALWLESGLAGRIDFMHFYMPGAWTANSLTVNITTAGASTCHASFGVMNDARTSLLVNSGVLTSATTLKCNPGTVPSVITITSSTSPAATGLGTQYPAGWYWLVKTTDDGTLAMTAVSNAASSLFVPILNAVTTQTGYATANQCTTTNAVLPASFSSPGACTIVAATNQNMFVVLSY